MGKYGNKKEVMVAATNHFLLVDFCKLFRKLMSVTSLAAMCYISAVALTEFDNLWWSYSSTEV
jgi:hypothetical protein